MTRPLSHFDAILEGDWIGEYEIIERLRSGGMATLYLGRRHGAAGFKRLAAIKVIHPHLSYDERFVRMFIDEARISAEISHPNVVHVEEFGRDRGLPFLVMEFIDGCSVSQLLRHLKKRDQPLSMAMASRVIIEAAGGLHGAHETRGSDGESLGVVHRDVSCSNILITKSGHIKLIDFGIALARGRLAETKTGFSLKGKLRYMSPEQANRQSIDRRSDVYSLGVVFWELLTNRALHEEADEIALLERLQSSAVEPPSKYNPAVPKEIDAIVLKMLAADPNDRPSTAWDLRRELIMAVPDALTVDSAELGKIIGGVSAYLREKERSAPSRSSTDGQPSFTTRLSHSRPGRLHRDNPDDYEMIEEIIEKPSLFQTIRSKIAIHQIVLAAAALVLLGLLSGRVLFGGGETPTRGASAVAPIGAAVAAQPKAGTESDGIDATGSETTQPEAVGPLAGAVNSTNDAVDATNPTDAIEAAEASDKSARARPAGTQVRRNRPVRSRTATKRRAARRAANTKASDDRGSVVVDGTRIADSPFGDDDGNAAPSSSASSSKTRTGTKVGDAPIVTDFED